MLWSAPRSRSTAFFRMMAERGDFTVVHEPFSYLAESGYADIAGERITAPGDLIGALSSLACRGRVFAKETTGRRYPEVLADRRFLGSGAVHTFLIRHPRETIVSPNVQYVAAGRCAPRRGLPSGAGARRAQPLPPIARWVTHHQRARARSWWRRRADAR